MPSPHDEPRPSGLRGLDERLVPVLQRGARRLGHVLSAPFRALASLDRAVAGGAPADWLWRHRQGLVFVTALLVFAGSYVHVERYDTRDAGAVASPNEVETSGDDGGALPGASAAFVGPEEGADVRAYATEQREELEEADAGERRVAVVSFGSYLDASQTAAVLPDDVVPVQLHLRVPAEEQDAFVLDLEPDSSVATLVEEEVSRLRKEVASQEADIAELLDSGTVDDPEYKAFYEAEVERLAGVRSLLGSDGGIVYGAVVRAEVASLRDLARQEAVRLVDLAPAEVDVETSTFAALLPERTAGGERDANAAGKSTRSGA